MGMIAFLDNFIHVRELLLSRKRLTIKRLASDFFGNKISSVLDQHEDDLSKYDCLKTL